MSLRTIHLPVLCVSLSLAALALAADEAVDFETIDESIDTRKALMEDVGAAAKPVGLMLRGERDYDWTVALESLRTWQDVGGEFGKHFPEGSESGSGTEAAPAIWEDREGFEAALTEWSEATSSAIAAAPATLDEARPVLGAVFNTCKDCHDGYRIETD